MSISRLPSGSFRAQVHDPRKGNVGVGKVLGGDSTFLTREEAEQARERAREALRQDPDLLARRAAAAAHRRAEALAERAEAASQKRDAIREKRAQWLAEGYSVDGRTGCWIWEGHTDGTGYGRVRREGRAGAKQQAHRWFFEQLVGPVPPSLVLDHLCGNRRCVNPEHLDPVTQTENTRRGFGG